MMFVRFSVYECTRHSASNILVERRYEKPTYNNKFNAVDAKSSQNEANWAEMSEEILNSFGWRKIQPSHNHFVLYLFRLMPFVCHIERDYASR